MNGIFFSCVCSHLHWIFVFCAHYIGRARASFQSLWLFFSSYMLSDLYTQFSIAAFGVHMDGVTSDSNLANRLRILIHHFN